MRKKDLIFCFNAPNSLPVFENSSAKISILTVKIEIYKLSQEGGVVGYLE